MTQEPLDSLFDRCPLPVSLVSSFDGSITYANRASGDEHLVGRHVTELSELDGDANWHDTPVGKVLGRGQGCVAAPSRRPGWTTVASLVPGDGEVLTTQHAGEDEHQALRQHEMMVIRTTLALELQQARRLNAVAANVIAQNGKHLDKMVKQLEATAWTPVAPRAAS